MIGMPRISIHHLQVALLAVTAAAGIGGCGSRQPAPKMAAARAERTEAATATEPSLPVTVEEGEKFARDLIAAVGSADVASLNELIAWDAIVKKASEDVDASQKFNKEFLQGVKEGATKRCGEAFFATVQGGGYFRPLHIHEVDGRKSALFRVLLGTGELTYYDMPLGRRSDGKIVALDFYGFASGEFISQLMRRGVVQAVAEHNRGLLARIAGSGNEQERALLIMARISDAQKAGKHQQAFQLYGTLPASFKKGKMAQMAHLAITQSLDEQQYLAAMDEYQSLYPDDPGVDLISIDYFILRKRYDKALVCVDRLDTMVDDPYLEAVRASIHLADGKSDLATEAADRAIEREPDEPRCYWVRVEISLKEKKFADTVRMLELLRTQLKIQLDDLSQQGAYAEFVQSPEYDAWMKSRAPIAAPSCPDKLRTAADKR